MAYRSVLGDRVSPWPGLAPVHIEPADDTNGPVSMSGMVPNTTLTEQRVTDIIRDVLRRELLPTYIPNESILTGKVQPSETVGYILATQTRDIDDVDQAEWVDIVDILTEADIASLVDDRYAFLDLSNITIDIATQAELSAHIDDIDDAHASTAVSVEATGVVVSEDTNAQHALRMVEERIQNIEEQFETHVHSEMPHGWVYNTSTGGTIVTITASGGFIALPWDADLYDRWGVHNPSSNNTRLNLGAVATGMWEIGATIFLGSPSLSASQDFYMSVRKNGSGVAADQFWCGAYFAPPTASVTPIVGMLGVVQINSSSDYIEVGAQIDGATSVAMTGGTGTFATNKCWFKYLGPA